MTAPDPLARRQVRLLRALRAATALAAGLAAAGLAVPDPLGRRLCAAALGVLIAAPLLRVAWLANRWRRRGDPRFAITAVGLLALVGAGPVVAALLV